MLIYLNRAASPELTASTISSLYETEKGACDRIPSGTWRWSGKGALRSENAYR